MTETSASYYAASVALRRIDSAVERAISKDAEEAERWWGAELADWAFNNQQRQQFNTQVDNLIARARGAVTDSRVELDARFKPHAPKPRQLKEDAEDWRERVDQANDVIRDLRTMSPIEGWTGGSAADYESTVQVQVAAMTELRGVMESVANGAERGAVLNEALFAIARNAIKEAHELADVDLPGGDGFFYRRTARWGDYVEQLPGVLRSIAALDNVQDALEVLRGQLGESLTMAELLETGSWPSGHEAAGTAPADTASAVSGDPTDDTDFEIPDSHTPGVCTGGAYRG